MTENWNKISVDTSPEKAELLRSLLEANGIPAVVVNNKGVFQLGKCTVYVPDEFKTQALELVGDE